MCVIETQPGSRGRVRRERLERLWLRLRGACGNSHVVTGCANSRHRLVEQDLITLDELNLLMALGARDILVRALQGEHRLLVVEEGGPPFLSSVTLDALCSSRSRKLSTS